MAYILASILFIASSFCSQAIHVILSVFLWDDIQKYPFGNPI